MADFLLIFRSRADTVKPSVEQADKRKAWFGKIVSEGRLAEKGNTLSMAAAKVVGPDRTVADGPWSSNGQIVSGYVVIKAQDIDDAVAAAMVNPIFEAGGSIEVREVAAFISAG